MPRWKAFFATLKSELSNLKRFASLDQLECELARYIHCYNHERVMLKRAEFGAVADQPLAA